MNLSLMEFFQEIIYQRKGTHQVDLVIERNTDVYFDSFGKEYIPQEVLDKIKYKSIIQKILTI